MWVIRTLPHHVINRLKAWEIVERPMSVVKELLENAIDAGATSCTIYIEQSGIGLIGVEDNGSWIAQDDLPLVVSRYATSKLRDEDDLQHLETYWFRWEALASIADVAALTLQTKQVDQDCAYELVAIDWIYHAQPTSFVLPHGTRIFIRDLFGSVPVRKKFLKSLQTEWKYIHDLVVEYALMHPQVAFRLWKDGKLVMDVMQHAHLQERIAAVLPEEWMSHMRAIDRSDDQMAVYGMVSDATLAVRSVSHTHLFVNSRPVHDKIIKKAVMDAYYRQLAPGMYPCVLLYVTLDPQLVDVNVHPRKLEVRFLDSNSVYSRVHTLVQDALWQQKIHQWERRPWPSFARPDHALSQAMAWGVVDQPSAFVPSVRLPVDFDGGAVKGLSLFADGDEHVEVLGQLWSMYIVMSSSQHLYLIDQHALAERITFERMKQAIERDWFVPEIILHPLQIAIPFGVDADRLIDQLVPFGFDIGRLSDRTMVLYAAPRALLDHVHDLVVIFAQLWWAEEISFTYLLDTILATKACKRSITAWQKLHHHEMAQLIRDWSDVIPGMFVCQHWRPSAVKLPRWAIDGWFDR
jgi:DNA mismatch repair protein MutL